MENEVLEVYTFKGHPDLREALQQVAFNAVPRTTSSAYINALVEGDPAVAKELRTIRAAKKKLAKN